MGGGGGGRGGMGGVPTDAFHWVPHPLKNEALEKNPEKLDSVINTCVSIIKEYWKKMAEIPQEHDFKGNQFVRKYYIT